MLLVLILAVRAASVVWFTPQIASIFASILQVRVRNAEQQQHEPWGGPKKPRQR